MDRILFLLSAAAWADAEPALHSAVQQAASADRLSIGLCLHETPEEKDLAAMRNYDRIQYLVTDQSVRALMPSLWQGEKYVLQGDPAMVFTRNWDMQLLHELKNCPDMRREGSILTGWLPSPRDPVTAVTTVGLKRIDKNGDLFYRKGSSLWFADGPTVSAFLHPGFVFGPASFFRETAAEPLPQFLSAYAHGRVIMTLHRPCIRFTRACDAVPDRLPENEEALLARFSEAFGVDFGLKAISPQAKMGVFTKDLRFGTEYPPAIRLREAWLHHIYRKTNATPLFVTMWQNLPNLIADDPEENLRRFSYLAGIADLPLLCFCDTLTARRAKPYLPNLLDYKPRYGLPIPAEEGEELVHLRLGLPELLCVSRDKFLKHSHFAWIDFNYLRYPVYAKAALDFDALCTERIALGMLGGLPDCSMYIIPEPLLDQAAAYTRDYCAVTRQQLGCLPEEHALWLQMISDHPEWFDIYDLNAHKSLLQLLMPGFEQV